MLLGSMCSAASKQSLALCHLERNTFTSALCWGGRNERSGMGGMGMDRGVMGMRKESGMCMEKRVEQKNGVERERREA